MICIIFIILLEYFIIIIKIKLSEFTKNTYCYKITLIN